MTTNSPRPTEFLLAMNAEIEDQIEELQAELSRKLLGVDYSRETALPRIFLNVTIRTVPGARERITKDDIGYTTWLIGELRGLLQTQAAHKLLSGLTPNATSYNPVLHREVIGALRAEMQIFADMLTIFNAQDPEPDVATQLSKRDFKTNSVSDAGSRAKQTPLPSTKNRDRLSLPGAKNPTQATQPAS